MGYVANQNQNMSNKQTVIYIDEAKEIQNPIVCCCMTVKCYTAILAIIYGVLAYQYPDSWRTYHAIWAGFYTVLVLTSIPLVFYFAGCVHQCTAWLYYLLAGVVTVTVIYTCNCGEKSDVTRENFQNWVQNIQDSVGNYLQIGTSHGDMVSFVIFILFMVLMARSMSAMGDIYYHYTEYLEQEKRKEENEKFVSV